MLRVPVVPGSDPRTAYGDLVDRGEAAARVWEGPGPGVWATAGAGPAARARKGGGGEGAGGADFCCGRQTAVFKQHNN